MFKHKGVVVGGHERVDRDRRDPGQHAAQECDRPVIGVQHQEKRPLLALDAGLFEGGGEAPRALVELAVGEAASVVHECGLPGAAGVRLQQPCGEVEGLGRRGNRALAHGSAFLPHLC